MGPRTGWFSGGCGQVGLEPVYEPEYCGRWVGEVGPVPVPARASGPIDRIVLTLSDFGLLGGSFVKGKVALPGDD